MNDALRTLPSVDEVLRRPAVRALEERVGRAAARAAVRHAIAAARGRILAGGAAEVSDAAVESAAAALTAPRLRRVINATGVVLHTNLGRAPLHAEAVARVAEVAAGYSNLELDLESGGRGHRHAHVEPLLVEVFGAEAAHVVNNCAGATLLALSALGGGGAAVVSRGELVEIGGGFRVPEILARSGCRLVEVGTTNRTHLRDYEEALQGLPEPRLVLRVHRSNFALIGFQAQPGLAELIRLAHERQALFVHDLGSGAVGALPDLPAEPTAAESLKAGADVVLASGDKLLGGPQAGLLLGRRDPIERCRRHPLARALRADKMLLAALEATLELYRQGRQAELPAIAALTAPGEVLRRRATRLALLLGENGVGCRVVECEGRVGGGSMPQARLPSAGVALDAQPAPGVLAALRAGSTPVLAMLRDGQVLLDVRCIGDDEVPSVAEAARAAVQTPLDAFRPDSDTLQGQEEG